MPTCHITNVSRAVHEFQYRKVRGGGLMTTGRIEIGGTATIHCADDSEVFYVQNELDHQGAVEGRVMLAEHEKAWLLYSWEGVVKEETAIDAAEHNVKAEAALSQAATDESIADGAETSSDSGPVTVTITQSGRGKRKVI